MTWYNLFSTELKYKITLRKSTLQPLVIIGQGVIWASIFLYCLHYVTQRISVQLHFITSSAFYYISFLLFFILIVVALFYQSYRALTRQRIHSSVLLAGSTFTINHQGICQFSVTDKRQLTAKSKLSWLGVYLYFEDVSPTTEVKRAGLNWFFLWCKESYMIKANHKPKCYFVYKDAFSVQAYARVSRIVLFCQNPSKQKGNDNKGNYKNNHKR